MVCAMALKGTYAFYHRKEISHFKLLYTLIGEGGF